MAKDEIEISSTTSPKEEIEKDLQDQGYEVIKDTPQAPEGTEEKPAPEEATDVEGESAHAGSGKKGGFQKRIDKLTRRNRELEGRLAQFEQAARVATPQAAPQPAQAVLQSGKPAIESFNTYEEFLEALADWRIDQKEAQRATKAAQNEQSAQFESIEKSYSERAEEAANKYPDWEEVIGQDDVLLPNVAVLAIKEAENGP
ncbi:MAG: hypothetical protein ACRD18_03715 [Terriglobia bacterium]